MHCNQIEKLNLLGDTCPTCEQPVDPTFKRSLVAEETQKATEAESEIAKIEKKIRRIKDDNKEFELINMGILSEHRSKGYGSLLLNHVLKKSFDNKANKVWVHTCSLDHKFALANYLSRGFKIFKKEQIDFVA